MSSSTTVEQPSPSGPSPSPSSPTLKHSTADYNPPFHTSTPNFVAKKTQPSLSVVLPSTVPSTPTTVYGEPTPTLTPPPRSPGGSTVPSGDARGGHPVDGTSSDKSSETAVAGVARSPTTALSRKESYKAQRQHYRREKKRAATALLHSIEDPSVVLLADWLKVRGSLKSWTKLWCVLKPGLLLLYKSSKAKSNHWVGTVLLTSCQVIERPSKKDGFCFKLYHPLEQSIWAPRGPHNETIGAVVQPLPTAHLIFRAPSPAAGHCWLDGLELALKCTNAMLRCSRSRPETQNTNEDVPDAHISHEELEKHFNEHAKLTEASTCSTPTRLLSVYDYAVKPQRKINSWTQFMESIDKDNSSASQSPENEERRTGKLFDFAKKKREFQIRTPILKRFVMPKLLIPLPLERKSKLSSPSLEESVFKLVTRFPRRSSTPSSVASKRVRELRPTRAKTDSENEDSIFERSGVIRETPDSVRILKTAPSIDRYSNYSEGVETKSSSSTDERPRLCRSETPATLYSAGKYSLIDCNHLPSASYAALKAEKRDERVSSQNVYIAGKIVVGELAGAASDTDSDEPRVAVVMSENSRPEDLVQQKNHIINKIESLYTEDLDLEIGPAGELVEEVAEENKSLIWFLMKQVRPGMDLSKVVLPTFILEPRSFLDKLSDSYYHADILGLASQLEDPYLRFKMVLRWYLSGLYKKPKGLKKPYNPVLGETFRCFWKHPASDTYTFYLAEQVSHHPPISAFYVSNRKEGFVIEGSLLARSKFFGNSTSAILEGCAKIVLLKWNESYITTAPYAHCKGIVIGTLSMELGGKVNIICNETGYSADIEFKLRSFLGSSESTNAISGRIKKGKETIATVEGYWDGRIDIKKRNNEESNLLDVSQLKEQRLRRYLVKLDQQQEFESQKLWIKVSEAILNDDQVIATEQKTIIEEAQRVRARSQNDSWTPRFFHKVSRVDPPEGIIDQGWRYNHENLIPWKANDELLEYEDNYVLKTLSSSPVASVSLRTSEPRRAILGTDSESQVDVTRRSKTSSRTLKMLQSIDSTLQDQTLAIERLSKTIDMMTEGNREVHRPQRPRSFTTNTPWDLFAGFVLAIVLQALLNWLFYSKV